MKRKNLLFSMLFVLVQIGVFAQARAVKGTITDSKTKETLPGVTVLVEGTTIATSTNMNGEFSINVDGEGKKLVVSSVGYGTITIPADQDVINVAMESDAKLLSETVVTALGVSREKKSLGYATQEVSGDKLTEVKSGNFVNQLSGKVAGLKIKSSGNIGGSTNVVIRGTTSMFGDNQALFVVDGIPMNNSTTNADVSTTPGGTSNQANGASGYDFGNPISDLNPEDIESVNVLKGAAATALYGSRAARGVIIITTKKGKLAGSGKERYGVTLNSNVTVGVVDKSTFPTYQNEYGAGYGRFYDGPGNQFLVKDFNANGTTDPNEIGTPYTEDASYGAKFDPNLMVYQWDSYIPGEPNYRKPTPWVGAGDKGPISFFDKSVGLTNSVNIDGATDKGSLRVSYSNLDQKGILPNSKFKKNTFGFNGEIKLNDKFSVSSTANYVRSEATGRNSTGYNDNEMTNFRQWWQTNVNLADQKAIYDKTGLNYSWNPGDFKDPLTPIYWNNVYFQRNESYTTDQRDRFYGNVVLNYKINSIFNVMARGAVDQYSTIQEERLAPGSISKAFGISRIAAGSGYSKYNKLYRETNLDLFLNFKKDLTEDFSLAGIIGTNVRRNSVNSTFGATNGGLAVKNLYSLENSKDLPEAAPESQLLTGVNGFFANISLGYKRFLYLDITARQDYSSTLPVDHNSFFYPGVSGSFLFSELVKTPWMDFGKVRLNYAKVGNDAPFASISPTYSKPSPFGSVPLFSIPNIKNNPNLEAELSTSSEAGLEMMFFKKRLGFDFAVYNTVTEKQIVPVTVSVATGYSQKYVNAGTVRNRGIELNLYGTPLQIQDFKWTVNVNFAKNVSKVMKLYEGVDNLQLANFGGGVTLNATLDQPYGVLKGTDYKYFNDDKNGKKIVGANGYYLKTATTDNVIGNINPDFTLGITNTFTYKNLSLSFLIDIQKGGDVYSLDMYYGSATGLYEESVGVNDLGNPKRDPLKDANGNFQGGIILDGVDKDGNPNQVRVAADKNVYGYSRNADRKFIYDASYVKLRELALNYRIPVKKEMFFSSATVGLVANNLWIIHKNLPYADPEAGLGAGNIQGYQVGILPTTRNFGFNLTLQF